jgi:peptidoglycan hydrolase-like protein with peptidoglycan-binding domain
MDNTWYQPERLGGPYVREVRWRLAMLGYLPVTETGSGGFDLKLIRAVQRFQKDKGLPVLGTIGPRTRAALDRELAEI